MSLTCHQSGGLDQPCKLAHVHKLRVLKKSIWTWRIQAACLRNIKSEGYLITFATFVIRSPYLLLWLYVNENMRACAQQAAALPFDLVRGTMENKQANKDQHNSSTLPVYSTFTKHLYIHRYIYSDLSATLV